MTEGQWLRCVDPQRMINALGPSASGRKMRLFACACCRRFWSMLTDERSRRAVEVAERFVDGSASREELALAFTRAQHARDEAYLNRPPGRGDGELICALHTAARVCHKDAFNTANYTAAWIHLPKSLSREAHLLRDIFGNPFQPEALARARSAIRTALAWQGGTVVQLARAIYEERRFEDMPVLADALEEAGCTDVEILRHCRSPGEHAPGCWALDLLLERE
jgi:hypothetical protein